MLQYFEYSSLACCLESERGYTLLPGGVVIGSSSIAQSYGHWGKTTGFGVTELFLEVLILWRNI